MSPNYVRCPSVPQNYTVYTYTSMCKKLWVQHYALFSVPPLLFERGGINIFLKKLIGGAKQLLKFWRETDIRGGDFFFSGGAAANLKIFHIHCVSFIQSFYLSTKTACTCIICFVNICKDDFYPH